MDRLNVSMDVLRRLAKEAEDPNCVVLAERAINDYLKPEMDELKAAIERVGKAIDEEDAKLATNSVIPASRARTTRCFSEWPVSMMIGT